MALGESNGEKLHCATGFDGGAVPRKRDAWEPPRVVSSALKNTSKIDHTDEISIAVGPS
jgi:hypothetical protein